MCVLLFLSLSFVRSSLDSLLTRARSCLADYSAKAAVDTQRDEPPAPPSRLAAAAFEREPLASPVPTYEPSSNGGGPAYPSQLDRHALRASTNTVMTHQSDSSSHELHRDPSVAAGKRAQRPPSSSAASDSFGYPAPYSPQDERAAYSGFQPQAPPVSHSASYANGASSPPPPPHQQHPGAYGVNGDFGSLRMDEFDDLARQMAADGVRAHGGAPPS